jgi:Fe-S-cluster-containing dehydrogenase component
MAIDMERCIGCSACMTACSAENNIGMVGPYQMKKGREINWIRIERYFAHEDADLAETITGGATFLPMMCQQCGNAPCEPELPVQGAVLQLLHLRVAGTAQLAAEPGRQRAREGHHGEVHVLRAAHP